MIVEVRTYRVKPGRRDEFVSIFESESVPAMRAFGMSVIGPFLDVENPNRFIWMRGFASLEARDESKDAFYSGEPWTTELESRLLPLLDSYDVTLCEVSPGFVDDLSPSRPPQ